MIAPQFGFSRVFIPLSILLVGAALRLDAAEPAPSSREGAAQGVPASRVKELMKERLAVARQYAEQTNRAYQNGGATLEEALKANRVLFNAELDLCQSDRERIAVLEKMVEAATRAEEQTIKLNKLGVAAPSALFNAKLERLDAQIALEEAKAKASARPK